MKSYLALSLVLLTAGCAAADQLAVLQNPKTDETVQCRVTEDDLFTVDPLQHCIQAYEKAGFVRIDEHKKTK